MGFRVTGFRVYECGTLGLERHICLNERLPSVDFSKSSAFCQGVFVQSEYRCNIFRGTLICRNPFAVIAASEENAC